MSRTVLNTILNQMQILLNETEKEQLHRELLAYFGLIDALNQCEGLLVRIRKSIIEGIPPQELAIQDSSLNEFIQRFYALGNVTL